MSGSPPRSLPAPPGRRQLSSRTRAGSKADWLRTRSGSMRRLRSIRSRATCSREFSGSGIPFVHFKESVMSTAKIVLVVLFLLVALGIVGRMDYEDAKRMERANIQDGIRLLCVRFPIDASGERGPSRSKRAPALLVAVAPTADVWMSVPAVFRCVIVDE